MAAKKSEVARILDKYLREIIGVVLLLINKNIDKFPEKIENLLHAKKRLRKNVISLIMLISGVTVILIGIGTLIHFLIPSLIPGFGYIIIGLLVGIIAILYKRF